MFHVCTACDAKLWRNSLARSSERIGGVPVITDGLEPHRQSIDQQQTSDEIFAEADDFANGLEPHESAENPGECPQDAGLGTSGNGAGRRRLRKEAAIGRI